MLPFSQRYGFVPIRQSMQIDSMDEQLRTRLWNTFKSRFADKIDARNVVLIQSTIWTEFLKKDIDQYDYHQFNGYIHTWFFQQAQWYEIYDFVEFCYVLVHNLPSLQVLEQGFNQEHNRVLERETAAYRLVNGLITRVVSEEEIGAIEEATQGGTSRWQPVTEHLRTALGMFSDRQNADYRNSVKESISAIESACKIISGDDKATLGTALKVLEAKGSIHPSLKAGFDKLYGYTSDQGGIRHAMLDSSNPVTFDEAKFMLVACSAFSNYLQPHLS